MKSGWKLCSFVVVFFNSRRHKYLRSVSSVVTFPLNDLLFSKVKVHVTNTKECTGIHHFAVFLLTGMRKMRISLLICIANDVLSTGRANTVVVSYTIMVVVHTKWNFTHGLDQTTESEHLVSLFCFVFSLCFTKMCLFAHQLKLNSLLMDPKQKVVDEGFTFKGMTAAKCFVVNINSIERFLCRVAYEDKQWHSYYPITGLITIICF